MVLCLPGQERDLHLRPHAIGRTHQHRVLPAGKQVAAAEAADIGQNGARERAPRMLADERDRAVRFIDADPRVLICDCDYSGCHFVERSFDPIIAIACISACVRPSATTSQVRGYTKSE